jgi:hypothetical protein
LGGKAEQIEGGTMTAWVRGYAFIFALALCATASTECYAGCWDTIVKFVGKHLPAASVAGALGVIEGTTKVGTEEILSYFHNRGTKVVTTDAVDELKDKYAAEEKTVCQLRSDLEETFAGRK